MTSNELTPSSLDVSVVICAFTEERWDDLAAAVQSVRRQTLTAREIIVVVDHNPAMADRVRAEMVDVIAVENRFSRGLSGARNSGTAVAAGAVIAFIDDDAIAAPDWLSWLVQGYNDPLVLGVGGGGAGLAQRPAELVPGRVRLDCRLCVSWDAATPGGRPANDRCQYVDAA